jgi:nicotinamidase-related amidase
MKRLQAAVTGAGGTVSLLLTRRTLTTAPNGTRTWRTGQTIVEVPACRTAVIVCDMWDRHWSAGATMRVGQLAPRIDQFCGLLRDAGVLVVHAPSDTIGAYQDSPARQRIAGCGPAPASLPVTTPPMPFLPSNGGSDTDDPLAADTPVWSRQHAAIAIDEDRDVITDDGRELAAYLRAVGRGTVLVTGVHANMCILRRSFGLVELAGYGFSPVLVADLTDAMYDPADPPYVDHDMGNELVFGYIQAFVASTTHSKNVVLNPGPAAVDDLAAIGRLSAGDQDDFEVARPVDAFDPI